MQRSSTRISDLRESHVLLVRDHFSQALCAFAFATPMPHLSARDELRFQSTFDLSDASRVSASATRRSQRSSRSVGPTWRIYRHAPGMTPIATSADTTQG